MERERERNVSYEIYQKALSFRSERLEKIANSKIHAKSEEVKPLWNGHGHVWYLVNKDMGFDNQGVSMFIEELQPHKANVMHRHMEEATVYILSGKGHTLLDWGIVEWEAGDAVFVPPMRWHQFFNDGEEVVRYIGMPSERVMRNLGLSLLQNVDMVPAEEKPHFPESLSVVSSEKVDFKGKVIPPNPGSQGVYEGERSYERELEERRVKSKIVARGKDVKPMWDGHSWTHYLVDPRVGFNAYCNQIFIEEIPPNQRTKEHRHLYEEAIYVLEGSGYTMLSGTKYEWKAGDALFMPPFSWHYSVNTDPTKRSRWLVQANSLIVKSLGYAAIEQRE